MGAFLREVCHVFAGLPDRVVGSAAMASALHQQFVAVIRRRHLSRRTEKAYWLWIMAYLRFHRGSEGWRHPRTMGATEVEAFLSHLAVERKVAAATQNQALNAIVFLYKQVLEIDPGSFHAVRARPSRRLPTVLSRREVALVINEIPPPIRLIAELMYGGGLRVGEACAVRVMDIDLDRLQLVVRRGKGDKDRVTPLPERLVDPLRTLVDARRGRHDEVRDVERIANRTCLWPFQAKPDILSSHARPYKEVDCMKSVPGRLLHPGTGLGDDPDRTSRLRDQCPDPIKRTIMGDFDSVRAAQRCINSSAEIVWSHDHAAEVASDSEAQREGSHPTTDGVSGGGRRVGYEAPAADLWRRAVALPR